MNINGEKKPYNTGTPQSDGPRGNLVRRLVSGAAWAFGAKLFGVGSGLVVNALLARMLAPGEMGAYFILLSIVMFMSLVARFGLKQTVVRFVAESMATSVPGRAGSMLRIVFTFIAIGVLVLGGGYYLWFGRWLAMDVFSFPILTNVTGLATLWIAVLAFQTPVAETFRGLHNIRLSVMLDGVLASGLLAVFLGIFWLYKFQISFTNIVQLTLISAGISLAYGLFLFLRQRKLFRGKGKIKVKEVVAISSPLFVSNVVNQAMASHSLWIAGLFLLAEDVALYGAALKLVNLVALPLAMVNMAVQPVISELYSTNDKLRLQYTLRGTATLAGAPALVILLVFMISGANVLSAVYGPQYKDASVVLAILSIGQLINVWSGSCGLVLAFTGHQKQYMYVTIGTSVVSVFFTVLLTIHWGLIGLASGVAASRIFQNLLAWYMVHHLTGLWTHGTIDRIFIRKALHRLWR